MSLIKHQVSAVLGLLLLISFIAGCASPGSKMANLSTGMTKAEVIHLMGKPSSSSGSGDTEILHYDLNASRALFSTDFGSYHVRLVNGRVESYGKGDDKPTTPTAKDTTQSK